MTALWTQTELSAALAAAPSAGLSVRVTGVSIDSRTLESDDLFFAIRGDAHDGHDHIARAFEAGAAAAVVSRERAPQLALLGPVFAVEDTLNAMQRLGVAARARATAKIVAVTGSVGKTTAKEMLRAIIGACR
jgi:UDP-N-acetylmuramoyl-tripeptide--D-alanyl-D-alanine ligase